MKITTYIVIYLTSIGFVLFPFFWEDSNNSYNSYGEPKHLTTFDYNNCQTGVITKHNMFNDNGVFGYFPERKKENVDGYIAVLNEEDMFKYFIITVNMSNKNTKNYVVYSADVAAEKDKPLIQERWEGKWIADLDKVLWEDADLPLMPVKGRLCELKNFP